MTEIARSHRGTCTKARSFKRALQVNLAASSNDQHRQQHPTENQYNRQPLTMALAAEIEMIGIAKHGSLTAGDPYRRAPC